MPHTPPFPDYGDDVSNAAEYNAFRNTLRAGQANYVDPAQLLGLTTDIVVALVKADGYPQDLPDLIGTVYQALDNARKGIGTLAPAPAASVYPGAKTKALSDKDIAESVSHDGLTSFEDGKTYKMLKRHLSIIGLTPDDYRAKWGLPADYPMTSPDYSARRSALAKAAGLGTKR